MHLTRRQLICAAGGTAVGWLSPGHAQTVGSLKISHQFPSGSLTEGDFRPGDRIMLTVTGNMTCKDTVSVREGRVVTVASFPDIPLRGQPVSSVSPSTNEGPDSRHARPRTASECRDDREHRPELGGLERVLRLRRQACDHARTCCRARAPKSISSHN